MKWEEERRWYRLASHLHLPVQHVQECTTSSELEKWDRYFEDAFYIHTPEHYYLATIAAEIRRGLLKDPSGTSPLAFLLKDPNVTLPQPKPKEDEDQQNEVTRRTAESKGRWGSILGIKPPEQNG